MGLPGAHFGQHRMLAVIPHRHGRVVVGRAFGMDQQAGAQAQHLALLLQGDADAGPFGTPIHGPALAQDADGRRPGHPFGQGRGQVAVAHDVAERGQLVVGRGHDGAAEAVPLGDMDVVDGGGGPGVPGLQGFQQLAGAVGQGQGPGIAGCGVGRGGIHQGHPVPAGGQGQRQGHAHRAGAQDQDVGIGGGAHDRCSMTASISATVRGAVV